MKDEQNKTIVEAAYIQNEAVPAKKKTGRPPGKKDGQSAKVTRAIKKTIELRMKGASLPEIAAATGTPQRTVRDRLKQFEPIFKELGNVEIYEKEKTSFLSAAEFALIKSMMSESKLKKAGIAALSLGYKTVHTANRLEKGLSTANVAKSIKFTDVSLDEIQAA
jgi:hypothetical protein